MMHRPVAVADAELVGGGDRGGDVGLGVAPRPRRGAGPCARPAAIADDSVQPVPCVFFVVDARRGEPRDRRRASTSRSIASAPLRVPALDQHRLGAEREQLLGLRAHLVFVLSRAAHRAAPRPPADSA